MAVKENVKNNNLVFFTRTNKRPFKKQKAGDVLYKTYGAVLDEKTGNIKVKVISTYNIVDTIQSYKKDVDIYELIKKYQNGDINALNQRNGVYTDISSMPIDLLSMSDSLHKIQGAFNALSDEAKKDLNLNSTRDFMESIASGQIFKYLSQKQNLNINKENVVKENEKGGVENGK